MSYLPLHATLAPLRPLHGAFNAREVVAESRKVWHLIKRSSHWNGIRLRLQGLAESGLLAANTSDPSGDVVHATLSDNANYRDLEELCQALISWRTGPYQLGNLHLDTEWRSYMKWKRIAPLLPRQPNMRIADVGCSNGYFLYKLSTLKPEIAIGFDPIERCWLQFALLQSIFRVPKIAFVPMGILSLTAFPAFFDLIVCMGVLYHQRDQSLAVRRLYAATRPGGSVVVESLVVPTHEPLVITPPDRYAKMRNAWTIPSAHHLSQLFHEAGFEDISVNPYGPLSTYEQRQTPLAPFESLADFLDPCDPTRTVEGHPAPHTAAVFGRKKR